MRMLFCCVVVLSLACAGIEEADAPYDIDQIEEEVARIHQGGNPKDFDTTRSRVSVPADLPALETAYLDTVAALYASATALQDAVVALRPPSGTHYSEDQLRPLTTTVAQIYEDAPEVRDKPTPRSGVCQDVAGMTGLDARALCHLQHRQGTHGLKTTLRQLPDLHNGRWVDVYFSLNSGAALPEGMLDSDDAPASLLPHLQAYQEHGADWQVLKEALFPQMATQLTQLTDPTASCAYRFHIRGLERVDQYAGQAGLLADSVITLRTERVLSEESRAIADALSVDGVYIAHVQLMSGTNGLRRVLEQCEGLPSQAQLIAMVE